MKMNRIVLSFVAALVGALPLTPGCANDSNPSDAQPTGTAVAAVTNVPNGVGCVVISAIGSWNTSYSVDVMPGQNVNVEFPVPTGTVAFSAAAYATACAQVTPASIASWVSASVVTTVNQGQVTALALDLQASGAGSISIGFTPPPSCTATAKPCINASECCSGYCAPNNTCQQSPGGCPPGQTQCAAVCVDTAIDPANCGACGLHCPTGTICAAGVCTGGGQCTTSADCPPSPNECQVTTCNAGVCGSFNLPFGLPAGNQIPGDCAMKVCDGMGNVLVSPDASDIPPDDGNPCTLEVCANGVPIHPPAADGTACPGGICLAGTCGNACTDGVKDGTETDVDCGGGACAPCVPGHDCLVNADCITNACDAFSKLCAPNQCFDHQKDGAETDVDCGGGACPLCTLGQKCLTNTDCTTNACDAFTLTCVPNQCADHHQDGLETDVDCGGGLCAQCAVGQKCNGTADCMPGHVCSNGTCF